MVQLRSSRWKYINGLMYCHSSVFTDQSDKTSLSPTSSPSSSCEVLSSSRLRGAWDKLSRFVAHLLHSLLQPSSSPLLSSWWWSRSPVWGPWWAGPARARRSRLWWGFPSSSTTACPGTPGWWSGYWWSRSSCQKLIKEFWTIFSHEWNLFCSALWKQRRKNRKNICTDFVFLIVSPVEVFVKVAAQELGLHVNFPLWILCLFPDDHHRCHRRHYEHKDLAGNGDGLMLNIWSSLEQNWPITV